MNGIHLDRTSILALLTDCLNLPFKYALCSPLCKIKKAKPLTVLSVMRTNNGMQGNFWNEIVQLRALLWVKNRVFFEMPFPEIKVNTGTYYESCFCFQKLQSLCIDSSLPTKIFLLMFSVLSGFCLFSDYAQHIFRLKFFQLPFSFILLCITSFPFTSSELTFFISCERDRMPGVLHSMWAARLNMTQN